MNAYPTAISERPRHGLSQVINGSRVVTPDSKIPALIAGAIVRDGDNLFPITDREWAAGA